MANAEGWSDYWREEGRKGEVFVDADGNKHPALTQFWQQKFEDLPTDARIVDIASGAGSIFAELDSLDKYELHANDLSPAAIELLTERMPSVTAIVAGAARLPYDDGSFDLVVSQFGIEYAGEAAFGEAARLVSADGRLVALVHYRDGHIDRRNAAELDAARIARDGDFIGHAIAVTRAVYAEDAAAFEQSFSDFGPAEKALAAAHDAQDHGVHAHLYAGFRRLFENRAQYDESDITDWLEAMRGELDRSIERLQTMREAALDREAVARIEAKLRDGGFDPVSVGAFVTPGNSTPVAWSLEARRA